MKDTDKNNIDRLFNEAFDNAENRHHFREDDWDAMEELLNDNKKRRGLISWYYISGIAAALLLAFGWYFLSPAVKPVKNNGNNTAAVTPRTATKNITPHTNISNGSTDTADHTIPGVQSGRQHQYTASASATGLQKKLGSNEAGQSSSADELLSAARNGRLVKNRIKTFAPVVNTTGEQPAQENQKALNLAMANEAGVDNIDNRIIANGVVKYPSQETVISGHIFDPVFPSSSKKKLLSGPNSPKLSLAIVAAPDLNGVASFNSAKVGSNYGVMLSLQLSKRWSITTGAGYAVKPYSATGDQYKTPVIAYKVAPTDVYANCKVLDIPLNINYSVYSKGRNAIAIGTGLSSYFMLREHYAMTFYNFNKEYINNYDFQNQNKHILSVLNLNATYQHRLNSKVSAIIQPYYKLPLSGIGAGKVNLQSTGVALGFNWNFGSKPK